MTPAVAPNTHTLVPATDALATLRAGSKSFSFAAAFLPARSRADVAELYAWCREVDDRIDLCAGDPDVELTRLRAELTAALAGHEAPPRQRAFAALVARHQIPHAYPLALLDGMAMDVRGTHYHTVDDLLTYAWRVAGVVGLMMCHVLGLADATARRHAAHLGLAMQLTNICRDVGEDWRNGRRYLPDALFNADALAALPTPGPTTALPPRELFAEPVAALLRRADTFYRSADRGLRALPWRTALAIRAARRIYAAIGDELAAVRFDVHAPRRVVSRPRKLWLAAGALVRSLPRLPWAWRFRAAPLPVLRFPEEVLP